MTHLLSEGSREELVFEVDLEKSVDLGMWKGHFMQRDRLDGKFESHESEDKFGKWYQVLVFRL